MHGERRAVHPCQEAAVAHDRFVKAVLTVIALALSVIALRPWLPEPGAVQAQTPMPKHEVTIPKEWGRFISFGNNNLLLEAPDKTLRIVDVEGRAPEYPKVKALIRWQ
jgi:hypothetical protein